MGAMSRISCHICMETTSYFLLLLVFVRGSPKTGACSDLVESQSVLNVENIFEFQYYQN